ncbi:MAG: MFS transporter [Saprospiraceae bacterium]|nr:MAG: MFS transporter [Saprospiraceae bacterium]
MNKTNFTSAFYTLIILFFMWGFLTSLNDILVPHLKAAFQLKHWQAQLVQFFFFGAYFVMSIPSGLIIKKVGYKKGIMLGLALMGMGCLLFYPASMVKMYGVFLLALFVLASGITILQVAANPYVAILGPPETAASRLNLAQGFNSLGHTLAPLFGAALILENVADVSVETVQGPYLGLAATLFILSGLFFYLKLPAIEYEETENKGFQLTHYPHLILGAIAIFCYVGAEISVGSFLVEYFKLESVMGLDPKTAGNYVAFYWGGAMVGRFMGAVALSDIKDTMRKALLMLAFPAVACLVVWVVLNAQGGDTSMAFKFLLVMLVNYLAFFLGRSQPARLLAVFALCCIGLLLVTMNTSGHFALWSILGIGLFNSIMWSNIFTLAIKDLGKNTSFGSSLLVMMIVGGAFIPVTQGLVADLPGIGVKYSFIVPAIAYLYLVFYGLKGHLIRKG